MDGFMAQAKALTEQARLGSLTQIVIAELQERNLGEVDLVKFLSAPENRHLLTRLIELWSCQAEENYPQKMIFKQIQGSVELAEFLWRRQRELPAEELHKLSILELHLTTRPMNPILRVGIKTIGELIQIKAEDLLKLKGFGESSLEEVRQALNRLGLSLRE